MAYLGNVPARSFISFERQVFTIVNSQTAYTLSHSVTNENDIRLVVNNIVQEPGSGKAYTASGTTLTLSAALVNGTDEMYCVFLGRAVGTVNAPAGSVTTSQIVADAVNGDKIADDSISDEHLDPTAITGQTAETSIADDDLILLSDTSASAALKKMTRANFVSGVGGANTPSFHVNLSSAQTVSDNVETKVEFDREVFDTASAFDNSTNYRFTVPSGEAGKYHFYFNILTAATVLSGADQLTGSFFLNGSNRGLFYGADARSNPGTKFTSYGIITLDLSVGDYVEVYGKVNYNSGTGSIGSGGTSRPDESCFGGFKLI